MEDKVTIELPIDAWALILEIISHVEDVSDEDTELLHSWRVVPNARNMEAN